MTRIRPALAAICLLVLVALLAPTALLAAPASYSSTLDSSVLEQLNEIRLEHGLVPLENSPFLNKAASEHSHAMISRGFFSHSSSDGSPFWQRLERDDPTFSHAHWLVGENLLWASGEPDAATSVALWMASPEHRANILNPLWRQIGIAAVSSTDAPGIYNGEPVTVITTDFGVRESEVPIRSAPPAHTAG